jgi:hypothetical protein
MYAGACTSNMHFLAADCVCLLRCRKAKNKEKEYDEQQKKIAEQIALAAKGSK